jgi:polyphenol oxidase
LKLENKQYYQELIKDENLETYLTTREGSLDWMINKGPLKNQVVIDMEQVHSNDIFEVNMMPRSCNRETVVCVDGLITKLKNVFLVVRTADCMPVIVYHPKSIIAVVHAGRKGTEECILYKALENIKERFNIFDGFKIWFGPAICNNCYQIDKKDNIYYDLVGQNKRQLAQAIDINKSTITYSNMCTCCKNDVFYSYRKEGQNAGRIYSIVKMD